MKLITHIIVVFLLSLLVQYLLPWWVMAVIAFATGLFFRQNGWLSFLAGFLGVGLLWMIAAWNIDLSTGSILSVRVAEILPVKHVWLLIVLAACIGGLAGGLSSMTGGIISHQKKNQY